LRLTAVRRFAAAEDLPSLAGLAGFAGALAAVVVVPGFALVRGSFGMCSSLDALLDGPAGARRGPPSNGRVFDGRISVSRAWIHRHGGA